jgi:hypothetical protein
VWDLHLEEFDSAMPVVFRSGADGTIDSLAVGLEATVDPIVFTRVVPMPPEAVLDRLVGTYRMGPIELEVTRRDAALQARLPMSGTVTLTPAGGTTFRVAGSSAVVLRFETDDAGAVRRLVAEPVGVFLPASAD